MSFCTHMISASGKTRQKLPKMMESWRRRLTRFLRPTKSDNWLAVLRIGLGVQVFLYALSLRSDWNYLFAGTDGGLNGRALSDALLSTQSPLVPRLGWLVTLGSAVGLSEWVVLSLSWWFLLCAAAGLLAGFLSRSSAITAWFIHLCVAKSGGLVAYGVDNFMTIGLFYLMWSPLPDRWSIDWRRRGETQTKDPWLLGFFRRVLQVHLCIIYLTSGIAKCLGSDWWNGSNVWRALTRPPFDVLPAEILVHGKLFFPLAGALICLLEASYPFLVWNRRTRLPSLLAICLMHLMIGLAMGMYLFGLVMIVLNLAAFGPDFSFRLEKIVPEWLKKGRAWTG
jgi:hypothetical protein